MDQEGFDQMKEQFQSQSNYVVMASMEEEQTDSPPCYYIRLERW